MEGTRAEFERRLDDARAEEFMGSLFVSLGGSFQKMGDTEQAERCFAEAARRGVVHFRT